MATVSSQTEVPLWPTAVAADDRGNILVGDQSRVRRIDARTGRITTVAGNGVTGFCGEGGPALNACIEPPQALAVDHDGNIYVTEGEGRRVLRIDAATGTLERIGGRIDLRCPAPGKDEPATEICFALTGALALESGQLLVADSNRVFGVDLASGQGTTVAGGAPYAAPCAVEVPATATCLDPASGLAILPSGDLLVATATAILGVDATSHVLSIVAGREFSSDESCTVGIEECPQFVGLAADAVGQVYVLDGDGGAVPGFGGQVRQLDRSSGALTTVWSAPPDTLSVPRGLAIDVDGALLIASGPPQGSFGPPNGTVERVDPATGHAELLAGSGSGDCGDGGPANGACLGSATDLAIDASGTIFVGEATGRVRRIDSATGIITTIVGGDASARGGASDAGPCGVSGRAASARLDDVRAIAVGVGADLFLAASGRAVGQGPVCVVRLDRASGTLATFAGNATCVPPDGVTYPPPVDGVDARQVCINPLDLAVGPMGDLYIDEGTRIRRVDASTGRIATIAGIGDQVTPNGSDLTCGDGGPARAACFLADSIAVDHAGNVFLLDQNGYTTPRVRRVAADSGTITTVAGGGSDCTRPIDGVAIGACFLDPEHIAMDRDGDLVISDAGFLRRVDLATGTLTTIAGDPTLHCIRNNDNHRDFGCLDVVDIDPDGRMLFLDFLGTAQSLVRRVTFGGGGDSLASD